MMTASNSLPTHFWPWHAANNIPISFRFTTHMTNAGCLCFHAWPEDRSASGKPPGQFPHRGARMSLWTGRSSSACRSSCFLGGKRSDRRARHALCVQRIEPTKIMGATVRCLCSDVQIWL